jgi:hypothetical protein
MGRYVGESTAKPSYPFAASRHPSVHHYIQLCIRHCLCKCLGRAGEDVTTVHQAGAGLDTGGAKILLKVKTTPIRKLSKGIVGPARTLPFLFLNIR